MKTVDVWISGCKLRTALASSVCIKARCLLPTEDLEYLRTREMYTFLELECAIKESKGTKPERLDDRTWDIVVRYHEHRRKREADADEHIRDQTVDRFLGRAA